MIVKVAGFNCDIESLEKDKQQYNITCETIAASYARISRDKRPIWEIRKDAREDVKSARDLNKRVVFEMGHSSIAEHAVFNLDIIGISRLAAEYVERFRLASYTEKSQRYIKLGEDFFIPEGLSVKLTDEYVTFVRDSFTLYEEIFQTILPEIQSKKRYKDEELKKRDIEGLAMEDARYVLPLSVTTQLGLTANARNIEFIIKILASSPLPEVRKIAKLILDETIKYAPSLIKYTEPERYFEKYWYSEYVDKPPDLDNLQSTPLSNDGVKLLSIKNDIDSLVSLYLFFNSKDSYEKALDYVRGLNEDRKKEIIYDIFTLLTKHNQTPRFFEAVTLEYELVMSASCYAQFKRHRMMTQIAQPYLFSLGFEIPPLVKECGLADKVLEHFKRCAVLYNKIYAENKHLAEYVVLNGNRRRVYAFLNARELYHISRLRMDHHAQWEIRRLSKNMIKLAQEKIPFIFDMCCGKDEFDDYMRRITK